MTAALLNKTFSITLCYVGFEQPIAWLKSIEQRTLAIGANITVYHLLLDWFGLDQTGKSSLIQTKYTGGQLYSGTSPIS